MPCWCAICAGWPTTDPENRLPSVTRKKLIAASPEAVFDLVADPYRLPAWWPRVVRVEDVSGNQGAERSRWTCVLAAESGRLLRLDYRCSDSNRPGRYEWEHELTGTPFEKHLVRQATRFRIEPGENGETRVEVTAIHSLRGTAKLAGFAMRKGQRKLLDSALGGLDYVLTGREEETEPA